MPTALPSVLLGPGPRSVTAGNGSFYVGLFDPSQVACTQAESGQTTWQIGTSAGRTNGIAVWQDVVVTTNRDTGTATLHDASSGALLAVLSVGALPWGVAATDGRAFVANFGDNTVSVLDLVARRVVTVVPVAVHPVTAVAANNQVYVLHLDGQVVHLNAQGQILAQVGTNAADARGLAWDQLRGRLYVSSRNGYVVALSTSTMGEIARFTLPGPAYAIALNPGTGRVFAVDATNDRLYVIEPDGSGVGEIALPPQGAAEGGQGIAAWNNRLVVANYAAGSLTYLDDATCPLRLTPAAAPTASATPTATATATPTASATLTATATASPTASATPTATATATPTASATLTATATATPTASATPTATATATPTASATPTATATATPTASATPTATATATPTASATLTATATATPTASATPTATATATPTASATPTATATATPTASATPTATATATPTTTATATPTASATLTATATATPTATATASPTASATPTATATASPTASATPTATATASPTASATSTVTATATPTASATPTPSVVRAKIEIVWPHDGASVRDANLANITAYLLAGDGDDQATALNSPPCDWSPTVRLWVALNTGPASRVAVGQKRLVTDGGHTFPAWDFNDVDVSAARDPANKLMFFVTVDGVRTLHNVWSHAADARTIFPQQDIPTGAGTQTPETVDARIEIVWSHDDLPLDQATQANITAFLFEQGALQAFDPQTAWSPTVRLHWALNSDVEQAPGSGLIGFPRVATTGAGLEFLVWDFNDVDTSATRDSLNKLYFWVSVDDVPTTSNIWAHGADARTIFPQPDILDSCQ